MKEDVNEIATAIAEKGAAYCSNPDLLAFMFGKITPVQRKALDEFINSGTLPEGKGIPARMRLKLQAFMELGSRLFKRGDIRITGPKDVADLCRDMAHLRQEHFVVITLNGANGVIARRTVFIGTLNHAVVHPREIFADAITDRAASVILVHNHPSGNIEPSTEDIVMTKKLVDVGSLVGIQVLDHVIVTDRGHYGFKTNGKLPQEV
jgi:DNA repair protein RadC